MTSTSTSNTVWIQLYIGDVKIGQPFDVTDFKLGGNVSALKEAVWTKKIDRLQQSSDAKDSTELNVYAAGTVVPIPDGAEVLAGNLTVSSLVATYEAPLIVKAEAPPTQQPHGK